jgi:3-deoxy-D-manno-octulosonate 8-phosphate phosphatase (KDO 8-P phosphatase)
MNIKPQLVVFDFDGVLTDNRVLVFEDGREGVFCNRADGIGFNLLKKYNFRTIIISSENNNVVHSRAKKLEIECFYGQKNKLNTLKEYCDKYSISLSNVLFIGNDLNDYEVMEAVGITACPADAHHKIFEISTFKLNNRGGFGVCREIAEEILQLKY